MEEKNTQTALLDEQLQNIMDATVKDMEANEKALIQRAQAMEDVKTYEDLTNFCYENVFAYIQNPDDLKKILTDPQSIEGMYAAISEDEDFKAICAEEYKGFPRVILMTVLAGSDALACHHAAALLKDDPEEATRLDNLANLYHHYLEEALAYGRGERKNIVFNDGKTAE